MKLEDQVVSLPLAKRLKELGVEQESLFVWNTCDKLEGNVRRVGSRNSFDYCPDCDIFSAFTVAELGEMLPDKYGTFRLGSPHGPFWRSGNVVGKWVQVADDCSTEAAARAKTLIHLIENGLLKTEGVGK